MKIKCYFLLTLSVLLSVSSLFCDGTLDIGIVSIKQCLNESKIGKNEQTSLEAMRKQMLEILEKTEKELSDLTAKFNDADYLDSLSPEAEEELKIKFQTLNQELSKYQNQYYQTINAANSKLIESINLMISKASENIAQEKNLKLVLNEYSSFFYIPSLNITDEVITEMDKIYNAEGSRTDSQD